ncbi:ParB/RepB/Spo0J family partition protein (plasmid) [Streptomyces sp. NBC_00289]|uniref:ParB/RepB/Spo0J family partition protein n=1 Tax=Streptomyces sp. NBC_00289 TaxID=2975703 RepID=UPI002F9074FA
MTRSKPQRVTRGFSVDDDGGDTGTPAPRRIRTRQQIINGEGKRPPAKVELALLAHNPYNPREELTNIEETADSLRAKGQIQPVTVARRAAFLTAHPGQEDTLGEAEYVVIDGNRRLAAAHLAGLEELRIDVNDDLAASAADLLESALIANIHREDVAPIDQAKAIQELTQVHGSQGEVARRLGKTPAWVSQRLALLELTPELQEKVEAGELKVEPARRIGRLPKEEQQAEAEMAISAVKAPRQRRRNPAGEASDALAVNAVDTPGGPAGSDSDATETVNAVNTSVQDAGPVGAADTGMDTSTQGEGGQPRRLPYDDAFYIVQHLHVKMTTENFVQGARFWMDVLRQQHPDAYGALLQELSQQEQPA